MKSRNVSLKELAGCRPETCALGSGTKYPTCFCDDVMLQHNLIRVMDVSDLVTES